MHRFRLPYALFEQNERSEDLYGLIMGVNYVRCISRRALVVFF